MKLDLILLISMLGIASISNLCEASKYAVQPNTKANWFEASQLCHANGMKLASIRSQADHDEIKQAIKDAGYATEELFWTSGTRLGNEDVKFFWMETGDFLEFTNWRSGEPNNGQGNEMCIFTDTYGWVDHDCSVKFGVICERCF